MCLSLKIFQSILRLLIFYWDIRSIVGFSILPKINGVSQHVSKSRQFQKSVFDRKGHQSLIKIVTYDDMKEYKGYQISNMGFFEPQKARKTTGSTCRNMFFELFRHLFFFWLFENGFILGPVMLIQKTHIWVDMLWSNGRYYHLRFCCFTFVRI